MPVVAPESKILVTGCNGYIAAWIVRTLLKRGYTIRGTVRSRDKGEKLKEIMNGLGLGFGDKFEYVLVPDITQEGAFDEAVKGVDAIIHTASPVQLSAEADPEEIIQPAVRGTLSILNSALKHGNSSVRRLVFTSSTAAVVEVLPEPKTFTEKDWNDQAIRESKEQGRNAPPMSKYRASKVLAERTAWKFVGDNKDTLNWDLVVFNPPFVFGPVTHHVPDLSALNVSAAIMYDTLVRSSGGKYSHDLNTGNCWIDVRDLSEIHALALEKEGVSNERILVTAGPYLWQEWVDIANSIAPKYLPSHQSLPKGVPIPADTKVVYRINYDTSKANRLLGIKYRSREECLKDTFGDYEAHGW
jgi:nucleoside-diphosphate-sugar epimerase